MEGRGIGPIPLKKEEERDGCGEAKLSFIDGDAIETIHYYACTELQHEDWLKP